MTLLVIDGQRWDNAPDDVVSYIRDLEAEVARLREGQRELICVYCNEGVWVDDENGLRLLKKHVEEDCPLHPYRAMKARCAKLEAALRLCASAAGGPDAGHACRNVIEIVAVALAERKDEGKAAEARAALAEGEKLQP